MFGSRAQLHALPIGVLCTLSLGAVQPLRAQEPAPSVAQIADPEAAYHAAIVRAVDEHERGHFEEAREHYREAHEIHPNARTLRGLGKVEFELRNYGESVRFLSEALRAEQRPLDAELRAEVEDLLERARAYVGEVQLDVQPGSATVSIDGVTVQSPPQAPLALLVGDHVFDFRAAGRLPERRHVSIRGRDRIDIRVTLAMPDAELVRVSSRERPTSTPVYKEWWVWAATGAVIAGAAGTAIGLSLRDRSGHSSRSSYGNDWAVQNP